jgi:DNA repair protein RecN (Recombination protein N)
VSELIDYDKEFDEMRESTSQFSITVREFSDFLHKFKENYSDSPEKLEGFEERLSLIEKLKKKYGSSIDEVLNFLEKAKQEFKELNSSQEKLEDLTETIEVKFNNYLKKAKEMSFQRKNHALELEKQIEKEIGLLGMQKAKFKIDIKTVLPDKNLMEKLRDSGTEEIEFLISPNPGEDVKPLRKIASGGELSRIMLALKSIGKEKNSLKALIFDEIDAGIGGKTAEFVAQKLKNLSKSNQVICITHLPQIASFAAHHYKIEKKIEKNRTYTVAKKLSYEERAIEIARLLAGSHLTETALRNAKEMLEHNLNK